LESSSFSKPFARFGEMKHIDGVEELHDVGEKDVVDAVSEEVFSGKTRVETASLRFWSAHGRNKHRRW